MSVVSVYANSSPLLATIELPLTPRLDAAPLDEDPTVKKFPVRENSYTRKNSFTRKSTIAPSSVWWAVGDQIAYKARLTTMNKTF